MGDAPSIRAGWPKLAIGFLKRLPEHTSESILGRVTSVRTRVRAASFRDFIELEHFVALATATVDALGTARAKLLWQDVMAEALRQPAVGELVRRAGVGNKDPIPLLERTADAFRFVHRGCGDWIVVGEPSTKSAQVTLEGAPKLTLESPAMVVVYTGNLAAAVASLGLDPQVFARTEPDARRLRFRVRW